MAEKVVINSSRVVQEVTIVSQPNITKVYINNQNGGGGSITGQNNTWREVYLGSYTDGDFSYEQLFDQELIVSETENVILIFSKLDSSEEDLGIPPVLYRYKFARGKGTWNPIPHVIGTDIIFESSLAPNSGDIDIITGGPNTQTYDLGDITGTDIWDFVTYNGPYDMSNPALTYLFLSVTDGITYLHQFIGTNGVYGTGETPAAESDFLLITTSTTIPVTYNLKVNETGETPLEFINKIEFDGATVASDGPNKVKVTITGGSDPTIEKLFTVSLAQIGASDITDVEDVRTKLRAYTIAEGLNKPAGETHNWEVVESLGLTSTLTISTNDLDAFATSIGVADVNDVNEWNDSGFLITSDFTTLEITGETITLSSLNSTLSAIGFGGFSEYVLGITVINFDSLAAIDLQNAVNNESINVTNCNILDQIFLNGNKFTVASLDSDLLDWATNEAPLGGIILISDNLEDLTTSDTYDVLVNTKSWTT